MGADAGVDSARAFARRAWGIGVDELRRLGTWLEVAHPRQPPEPRWATEGAVEAISDTVSLRRYGGRGAGLPTLVVTPQVNHSYIADFGPSQSLVRTLLQAGVPSVAVTDWLEPRGAARYGIAESLDDLFACVERLGGRAHLVGLCQGGWQVAMAAALRPERVGTLVVAAAPIDAHAGATLLHAFVFGLPMTFFEAVVRAGGGVAPGRMLASGFDLLRPFERFVSNDLGLWLNADDAGYVRRAEELRNWYRLNKGVAGALYLEAVRRLFKDNELARGRFDVRGERLDLGALTGRVHLLAGERDHITPAAQVFALDRLAPRATVTRHLVDAGHVGVFMGRRALTTAWPEVARDLVGEP